MPSDPPPAVGITLPEDFPAKPYDAVSECLSRQSGSNLASYYQFAGAWHAVAHRFRACTDHDVAYADVNKHPGTSVPESFEDVYIQQKELFGFFSTGLSTIESLCYALYAIGSMAPGKRPDDFPISEAKHLRRINIHQTTGYFESSFPRYRITALLRERLGKERVTQSGSCPPKTVWNDPVFGEWNELRNVLVHRVLPSRIIYMGGTHHGAVEWPQAIPEDVCANSSTGATRLEWKAITLDEDATGSKRRWLAATMQELLGATKDFVYDRLGC